MSSAFVAVNVLSAVRVISPAKLLVTSFNVPPAKVRFSAPTATLYKSSTAPDATDVPPTVLPSALLLVITTVPAEIVVTPL